MLLGRERLIVAPDALSVCAVRLRRGLRGVQLTACSSVPLARGALTPSPVERNVARAAELRDALTDLLSRLGGRTHGADLVLPAGAAGVQLVEPNGRPPRTDELRLHLASSPPFAAPDAILGKMPAGQGGWLVAAARRSVVEEYEALLASVGLRPGRVELASLVALHGLLRQPLPEGSLDVVLSDTTAALAVWKGGSLAHLRTRLRADSSDDSAWLWQEAERTTLVAGQGSLSGLRAVGRGAAELVRRAAARGLPATLAWSLPLADGGLQAADLSWLGGLLA